FAVNRFRCVKDRLVSGMRISAAIVRLGGCPRGRAQQLGGLRGGGVGEASPRIGGGLHGAYHTQPVLGERPCLVKTYGVHPAQRLDGARCADQRSPGGQSLGGGERGKGRGQRQALGDGGHRDGDAVGDGLTQRSASQQRQTGNR